ALYLGAVGMLYLGAVGMPAPLFLPKLYTEPPSRKTTCNQRPTLVTLLLKTRQMSRLGSRTTTTNYRGKQGSGPLRTLMCLEIASARPTSIPVTTLNRVREKRDSTRVS
ncbi:hypothetical protein C8Q78DRAFT_1049317, partial [Trametes maxima]